MTQRGMAPHIVFSCAGLAVSCIKYQRYRFTPRYSSVDFHFSVEPKLHVVLLGLLQPHRSKDYKVSPLCRSPASAVDQVYGGSRLSIPVVPDLDPRAIVF